MNRLEAHDTPTTVTSVDGEVVLDGPDGLGLSMTPAAAKETGKRLVKAAADAKRNRHRRPRADGVG